MLLRGRPVRVGCKLNQIEGACKAVLGTSTMVGKRLLHYEIIDKLGQGGMGGVYKARDTHLDRSIAIKILPRPWLADPGRRARFVQEAKAASALNHPNIITVHDISEADGVTFIAMEYVKGSRLDELIPAPGMSLHRALDIAVQIADAVAGAHAAGIVHRDLKPVNMMVNENGLVKVFDFGVAKLTEADAVSAGEPTRTMEAAHARGRRRRDSRVHVTGAGVILPAPFSTPRSSARHCRPTAHPESRRMSRPRFDRCIRLVRQPFARTLRSC